MRQPSQMMTADVKIKHSVALQANGKFAKTAESSIRCAAPLAPVVFGTAEERNILPHLEDIGLVRLLLLLQLRLSCDLFLGPS